MTRARELAELAAAYDSGGLSNMRNRIINGAMVIDQRNAGASVATSSGTFLYSLDRWQAIYAQTSKYTIQQNAGAVTPPVGFVNYLGITSTSAYSALTNDYFSIRQIIEGFNIADLGWGTANAQAVTLSFQVRSSLTGTFGGALVNGAENRSYPFSYTVSSANTWTTISLTIAGDTSGTWLTTNGQGVQVRFGLGAGATYLGTAGAWASSNIIQPTSTVSVVGTNGATFYITGVQLEEGVVSTNFDVRPYGTELQLCQRYYELMGVLLSNSGGNLITAFPKVSKRVSPTLVTTPSGGSGGTYSIITTVANEPGSSGYYQSVNHSIVSGAILSASAEL